MAIRHLCSADVWSPEVRTTGDGGFFGLWKPENPAQGPRGHPAGLQRALGSRGVMWRRVGGWETSTLKNSIIESQITLQTLWQSLLMVSLL